MGKIGYPECTTIEQFVHKVISEDCSSTEQKVIDHVVTYKWNLWVLLRSRGGDVTVHLYLLEQDPDGEFSYKDLSEIEGPLETDCPKSFVTACTPTDSDIANEWRQKVITVHESLGTVEFLPFGKR